MKRREFILLIGGTIALEPIPLRAQQNARFFKIGHLESSTPSDSPHLLGAFRTDPTRRISSRAKSSASTAEKQPRERRGVGETREIVFPDIRCSSLNRRLVCCRKQVRGRAMDRQCRDDE